MRNWIGGAAGPMLCLGQPVVAADTTAVLEPVSPWNLDYGITQCTAMRSYGSAKEPVTFALVPAPEGDTYELLVGYKRVAPEFAEELEGTVEFGSGPIKSWLLRYGSKDRKLTIYQFRIGSADMTQARTARSVTFHIKGAPDVAFSLEKIPALMDGLAKCSDDLKDYWNMDGKTVARAAAVAKGDLRSIFSANDYPWEASSRWQQGTSQYLLMIDEKGKVAGCHVAVPSGVPILDVMGCAVIEERAKFQPAADSKGTPVRSTLVTPPVSWRMEG